MKRKRSLILTWLSLMMLSTGSSCSAAPLLPPRLEDRRLALLPDRPGFYYEYERCLKEILGLCLKTEWVVEVYDLTDPLTRQKLRDMGFTATSERRWQ